MAPKKKKVKATKAQIKAAAQMRALAKAYHNLNKALRATQKSMKAAGVVSPPFRGEPPFRA